jgi:hypothetical protein
MRSDSKHDVFFRRNVGRYWKAVGSNATTIFMTVITGNRCIEVICTRSHKITSLETIQIYRCVKVRRQTVWRDDDVVTYSFMQVQW